MHYPFKSITKILLATLFVFSSYKSSDYETEILWDNFGVPHIYARNNQEMYYSFGWAQMSCHADLILRLYTEARGNASEYFGREYIESDKMIHAFNLHELARNDYLAQGEEFRSYIDAFVKGMNDYAAKNPEVISESLRPILPVTANDVISHTKRVIFLEFLAGSDIGTAENPPVPGSSAIAIGKSKSASGNAMLLTNPHLPWYDYFTWFEAHLNTMGFNAYGIAFVGMPELSMAFNNNLGWAHTVNPIDASDRFELTLKDDGYLFDNKVMPFKSKKITIKVRQEDGSVNEIIYQVKYSKHGPVLGEKEGKAWAVRIAGLDNHRISEQYHRMAKAKNILEFESALGMLQCPMFNVIYADRAGNILFVFNGNIPKRPGGDFSSWKGIVDGSSSVNLWQQILEYKELPRVLNPPSGFIQNCNDPPWTCTYPPVLDPAGFPSYISPRWMGLRPQRAVNMIKDNPSISFNQLIDYKLNTGMETADRFLDDLLEAAEKYPDSTALKAAEVLKNWDRKTESDSRGALLFAEWWGKVNRNMFKIQWDPESPVSTPYGLKDEEQAAKLLSEAASAVLEKYGSLDIPWGDVHRFRINEIDYPGNGGPDNLGIFRTIYFIDDQNSKKRPVAGDTYIAVTEFGKKVKASVLLSYGNATQKGNRHIGDQLKLMSEKKLRPALLEKSEILDNLEKREIVKIE